MNDHARTILNDLVGMTREIGSPEADHVVLGEGNTSARIDDGSFFVKGSGESLRTIDESGFVAVDMKRALALLDSGDLQGDELRDALLAIKKDPQAPGRPSIEVLMHAVVLQAGQAEFAAHTHTTVINELLCSDRAHRFAHERIFPDQIVLCGPDSAFVPYVDPGLPLGRAVHQSIEEYDKEYGIPPKTIMLKNHGIVVVGQSRLEVEAILAMITKAARIYSGACAVGEPVGLSRQDIERIYRRSDEAYRRRKLLRE
jgi:rhamnose utilization protein RhaD (predicted bifunctional aldolase and dehydrogenase)